MPILSTIKIIICGVIEEEVRSLLPPNTHIEILGSDHHHNPEKLHAVLQESIDTTSEEIDTIIFGYGLCSLALVGLKASRCKLIIPRVDDCIALFLGSSEAYQRQNSQEPGTYYMTKGWINAGITPFEEHEQLVRIYGSERAEFMTNLLFKDFKRLVYINNQNTDTEQYCKYSRQSANQFGLQFEEVAGSIQYFKKLLFGPWDSDFVIVMPGEEITFSDFK